MFVISMKVLYRDTIRFEVPSRDSLYSLSTEQTERRTEHLFLDLSTEQRSPDQETLNQEYYETFLTRDAVHCTQTQETLIHCQTESQELLEIHRLTRVG